MIEYNIEDNEYKIKDLGIGFGVFFRLDYQLVYLILAPYLFCLDSQR